MQAVQAYAWPGRADGGHDEIVCVHGAAGEKAALALKQCAPYEQGDVR